MALTIQAHAHEGAAPQEGTFIRFGIWQRMEHWFLVAGFVALVMTGLPQRFDDASASVWLINTLGGIDNARFIHRVLATAFIVQSVVHVAEIGVSIVSRRFRPSMVITLQDFLDAFNMLRYSVGLTPKRPDFDRYDFRQKYEYWGIVFGAVIMVATGLVLWFPTYVTRLLPGELVPVAKEMHSGEALLALMVIVVWHLYDVVLSPAVFPLDTAMITGRISGERLHHEHGKEYARLVAGNAVEAPLVGLRPASAPGEGQARWAGAIKRSLQWRVMLLVTIGLAGILAAFSVSSFLAVNESIDRTLEERQALAEATAGHVDYVVRQGLQVLEEAAASDGFDLLDADPEPERQLLRQALPAYTFGRLYLADADGDVLWTEPFDQSLLGLNIGFSRNVEAALDGGRPTVSGLATAMVGEEPVMSMVAPVRGSSGQIVGLLAGDIVLGDTGLADVIRPAAVGSTGYAQIVDSQGTVVASTRSGQLLQKSDHEGQVATLIQEKRTSSGTCHGCHESAGGAERETEVMAFAPLELAPWGVLIRQSESEALAPADRLRERALWLGIPAFLLALLFAWVTARSVLRPMRVLTATAQKISAGDLSEEVPNLGEDEVGSLARTLEVMRKRLKESLDTVQAWGRQLEVRVQERTRELERSHDELKAIAEENAALNEELRRKEEARTRLLQKVIRAQEEERRRIARELHDETSQALTALALGMETAGLAPGGESAVLKEKLTGLKELAVDTLEDVHRLIYDLRPSVLDDLGFVAGLRWYAESRLQPAGVRARVRVSGEEQRLPAELETALFRIGQEAMSNVARHAQATNVFLGLDFQDSRIILEVEDDGRGFDPAGIAESAGPRPGWGILGMQERATLLEGTLKIDSVPGSGTRVRVSIPLEEGRDGDAEDSRIDSR
jgi:signal transduction histidine kinase/cytochrome b subunit of formate dehydrogenase